MTVEGGLRHDLLKQDAFAEKGSALGWSGNSLTEGTLVGLAGLKLSQPLSDKAVLSATAGVERDLNGRDYAVTGGFTGAAAATGKTGARNMPHTRRVAGLGWMSNSATAGTAWHVTATPVPNSTATTADKSA